ncbi:MULTISPECIES: lytic transglycosylase domain-containing protein [Tsukamurella]|uniref:Murein transglycosylase n=2 Tax=Tsukamurella TaxID=2060 RepID=A0A5C5S2M5_9ACTN|nr:MULTISPECIES: lytic murein transglycosylase [Tsukamurella]NMD55240.1 murein transglycosylase [Tsukamurella columbiensis]TWS28960.1 murein transglycosylase [Tsukamurella conjunctivitidis]
MVSSRLRTAVVVGVASTVLAGCGALEPRPEIPQGIPPGAGAPVPLIDVNGPGRTSELLRDWATPISVATGIPVISLEAYGNAAEALRQRTPECGIAWTTLAGIAFIESKHGTYHGATVAPNGKVSPPIRGVPLDGTNGNQEILATGTDPHRPNAKFDAAMGPFQFIPETWQRFGVDANGDGKADPDNIDDAAMTAARYLCVSGKDLTTAKGWEKAVMVYNQSRKYVLDVRDAAAAYSVNVQP